jgi:hypothetical protein
MPEKVKVVRVKSIAHEVDHVPGLHHDVYAAPLLSMIVTERSDNVAAPEHEPTKTHRLYSAAAKLAFAS